MNNFPRSQWLRLWQACEPAHIKALAKQVSAGCNISDLHIPKAGLGLLQLRDSALGDAYFLGEIPVTKSHVRIHHPEGKVAEGAAVCMDDRVGLTRAMAILDGVLSAKLPGWELVERSLHTGASQVQADTALRRANLSATKVDFSLLGALEEDDHV
ncbi:MAG: phosphonate C-P lyase system protein PhnG [Pseudomonadota bacterium]|jgi:alpha-D-ribose 1-methylphosphonate 5-triphosphate synthase subunit PhnG|uniref:phosphonate C-P lyase system protein PhnG n=1 Tax=Limnobacter alexandrii TaxID=2570352 RepID=UPI0011095C76|nr:phosphonate C-P lyase system protein PhnG [Limnobacter alexandrii]